MNEANLVLEILRQIRVLGELVEDVVKAATSENPSRVQDVIPATLETSIARLRAEIEAQRKFGPRDAGDALQTDAGAALRTDVRDARDSAVMKKSDQTFWVRGEEKWLPRVYGAPPPGCAMPRAEAESLLRAVRLHGHTDAEIVSMW